MTELNLLDQIDQVQLEAEASVILALCDELCKVTTIMEHASDDVDLSDYAIFQEADTEAAPKQTPPPAQQQQQAPPPPAQETPAAAPAPEAQQQQQAPAPAQTEPAATQSKESWIRRTNPKTGEKEPLIKSIGQFLFRLLARIGKWIKDVFTGRKAKETNAKIAELEKKVTELQSKPIPVANEQQPQKDYGQAVEKLNAEVENLKKLSEANSNSNGETANAVKSISDKISSLTSAITSASGTAKSNAGAIVAISNELESLKKSDNVDATARQNIDTLRYAIIDLNDTLSYNAKSSLNAKYAVEKDGVKAWVSQDPTDAKRILFSINVNWWIIGSTIHELESKLEHAEDLFSEAPLRGIAAMIRVEIPESLLMSNTEHGCASSDPGGNLLTEVLNTVSKCTRFAADIEKFAAKGNAFMQNPQNAINAVVPKQFKDADPKDVIAKLGKELTAYQQKIVKFITAVNTYNDATAYCIEQLVGKIEKMKSNASSNIRGTWYDAPLWGMDSTK